MKEFSCSKCAKCCSNFLPLTKKEITELKTLVKNRKIRPVEHILVGDYKMICPFLNSSNRCIIYENRPIICRAFTCQKFINHDFEGLDLKEKYILTDLRKELFND